MELLLILGNSWSINYYENNILCETPPMEAVMMDWISIISLIILIIIELIRDYL